MSDCLDRDRTDAQGAAALGLQAPHQCTRERMQLDRPLETVRPIQRRLADMRRTIALGLSDYLPAGRQRDIGRLYAAAISLAKRNSDSEAFDIARASHDLHGVSGDAVEYYTIGKVMNIKPGAADAGAREARALNRGHGQISTQAFA